MALQQPGLEIHAGPLQFSGRRFCWTSSATHLTALAQTSAFPFTFAGYSWHLVGALATFCLHVGWLMLIAAQSALLFCHSHTWSCADKAVGSAPVSLTRVRASMVASPAPGTGAPQPTVSHILHMQLVHLSQLSNVVNSSSWRTHVPQGFQDREEGVLPNLQGRRLHLI